MRSQHVSRSCRAAVLQLVHAPWHLPAAGRLRVQAALARLRSDLAFRIARWQQVGLDIHSIAYLGTLDVFGLLASAYPLWLIKEALRTNCFDKQICVTFANIVHIFET